ncbi:MAG: acyl carrier protein [Actinomycetota bacterium]|nr:acyl carrier protein [Actinomycetota bacterium]
MSAAGTARAAIFAKVRDHLATELELDPAEIDDGTHFREDLDADSLDLYELVMELEDTYGVAMSDEEASRIHTVGAAVDFVAERAA